MTMKSFDKSLFNLWYLNHEVIYLNELCTILKLVPYKLCKLVTAPANLTGRDLLDVIHNNFSA